LSTQKLLLRV